MKRPHLTLALALAGATLGGSNAGAAAEHTIGGTTVVTATTSARLRIVVTEPASVDPSAVELDGNGRLVAVAVRRVGEVEPRLLIGRFNLCHAAGCAASPLAVNAVAVPEEGEPAVVRLERGRYDVTLVADGAAVRATLPFDGLDGEVTLVASEPVAAAQWHAPATATPATVVADGQATMTLARGQVLLAGFAATGTGSFLSCDYAGATGDPGACGQAATAEDGAWMGGTSRLEVGADGPVESAWGRLSVRTATPGTWVVQRQAHFVQASNGWAALAAVVTA